MPHSPTSSDSLVLADPQIDVVEERSLASEDTANAAPGTLEEHCAVTAGRVLSLCHPDTVRITVQASGEH